ncbi:MAG TPA: lamin tail domain-containing protein [Verrucomicrobiales bacterium]|nr:lamin tail domain-containing protein [Verrucomicrobiales bacterium]
MLAPFFDRGLRLAVVVCAGLGPASLLWASPDSVVVINEIQYHPGGETEEAEWIEFHNQNAVDVDISGWKVCGGIAYTFPDGTVLTGKGYLVLAANPEWTPGSQGTYTGRLSNGGEEIRLCNRNGHAMSVVDYGDGDSWGVGADGSGCSLAKVDEDGSSSLAENWRASLRRNGTPGATNFPQGAPPDGLRFHEICPAGAEEPFVELRNDGMAAVALDGLILRSSAGENEIPVGAGDLEPGALAAVWVEASGWTGLADGDRVFLFAGDGETLLDAARVREAGRGRLPGGDSRWYTPERATPGEANVFAFEDRVVINEIMYHHRAWYGEAGDATSLVKLGSRWKYFQDATLGAGWAEEAEGGGGGWAEGDALLGKMAAGTAIPAPIGTEIAGGKPVSYFEIEFEVPADALGLPIYLRYVVDDGAVFYLNGTEVHRFNLPDGAISSTTKPLSTVQTPVLSASVLLPEEEFQEGLNRLSAQVHSDGVFDTDIVFGAQVYPVGPGYPPLEHMENREEWIEFYNRGDDPVDLSGWELTDAVSYRFPEGAILAPGAYLVAARDAAALSRRLPGTAVVGDFSGALANDTDRIVLRDALGNPADEVRYYDGGRWPATADGRGSSLELRNPWADNSAAESWAGSDEGSKSEWREFSYTAPATRVPGSNDPRQWNEFVFGLLGAGEFLIDDISVVEDPEGAGTQLIRNGDFKPSLFGADGTQGWRFLGNHGGHGRTVLVEDADGDPASKVLRVTATGRTEHMHNHIETTLAGGARVVDGRDYHIRFRARWLSGSPRLHTRLYFNYLARTNFLQMPAEHGTPGARNSRFEENPGPVFKDLRQAPVIPMPGQATEVAVRIADPQGVARATLRWAQNGGEFQDTAMEEQEDGFYTAEIAGLPAATLAQYYVEAEDGAGAIEWFPAGGPESRALYVVEDDRDSDGPAHNLRILTTPQDADWLHQDYNVMSNHRMPCTVIYREREIFHDVGVRLKGSQRGRNQPVRTGFILEFPRDRPFRGVHQGIAIDRSGAGDQYSQKEILVKHAINRAGGIAGMYDDLIHVITPREAHTGAAMLLMSRFQSRWLDTAFENGSDGNMYEYELIYYPTTTTGGVEGYKRPNPDNVSGVPLRDLGPEKDAYRWHYILENNTDGDDYAPLIRLLQTMGMSQGPEFHAQARETLDIDQWLRAFAIQVLFGIGDNYSSGAQHNAIFYFRPSDGRALHFPWDLDFTFSSGTTSSLTPNADLTKLVSDPVNRRSYYAHLHDLTDEVFNREYLGPWAEHYSAFLPRENLTTHLSYIEQRSAYVKSQINSQYPQVAFEITTNGGQNFETAEPWLTLEGRGGINVRGIRLNGAEESLEVVWTSGDSWRVRFPLQPGGNAIHLQAVDYQGSTGSIFAPLGDDSITVTYTGSVRPAAAGNLTVSELMYHPPDPSAAERGFGFEDADEFEFIELMNIGGFPIDVSGVRFSDGIEFVFGSGSPRILPAGARVVLVENFAAFAARYGASPVPEGQYGGRLSNSGETITLLDASGGVIESFTWRDSDPWPAAADGLGSSLDRIDPASGNDPADPGSWRASAAGGSPGSGDAVEGIAFAEWMQQQGLTDPLADPESDGMNALLEFAFGADLAAGGPAAVLPSVERGDGTEGGVRVRYRERAGALEITYFREWSEDLLAWAEDPGDGSRIREESRENLADGTVLVTLLVGGREGAIRIRVRADAAEG